MKKAFRYYILSWVLLLAVFNVVLVVVPFIPSFAQATASFWIGFLGINLAMIGQLICAWIAFDEKQSKKAFLHMSLFKISYAGLILTFIAGIVCILIPGLPYWVGGAVCPVILVLCFVAIAKAKIAIEVIADIDEKVEKATAFIYEMRDLSSVLAVRAKGDVEKELCKKVNVAFKYSDPMSKPELATIEADIKKHFYFLQRALDEGEIQLVEHEAEEVLALILERNNLCKTIK